MRFLEEKLLAEVHNKLGIMKASIFSVVSLLVLACANQSKADFDEVYTGASETAATPPKVEFKCRLTPNEKIIAVKVKAGDDELFPKVVQYVDQADVKTAVLFLIDTSNPKRAREVALAQKLVVDALSQADEKRHVLGVYPFHGELDDQFAPMGTPLKDLKAKAADIKANGINTILYGSVLKAIGLLEHTEAERKAIVVISDWKSEDNVMDTREFIDTALKQLKSGKIVCHSVVLVEEDQSELDTAEKLSSATGGQFVKVTRQSMQVPGTFTQNFFGHIENGGTAIVDMAGRESATKVVFEVETAEGKKYEYTFDRKAKSGGGAVPDVNPTDPKPDPDAPAAGGGAEPSDPADPEDKVDEADEPEADDVSSEEEESEGIIADLMNGKDLFGMPIWMILAGIALIVLVLIVIVVMLMRGKDEDEFDTEFSIPEADGEFPTGEAIEGMELPASDMPPLPDAPPAAPQYPEQFDLGNGVALCRTLPEAGENVVATLQFGENAVRGIYPISVSKTAVRIGRGSDNDLSFNNDSVSRHHAEILSKRDGTYSITDLDSGNGVFVNGQEITQSALQSGDKVEIGEVVFVFNTES